MLMLVMRHFQKHAYSVKNGEEMKKGDMVFIVPEIDIEVGILTYWKGEYASIATKNGRVIGRWFLTPEGACYYLNARRRA